MDIKDIKLESDILVYLGGRLDNVCELFNRIFETKNIKFYGTEFDIPKYYGNRRIYGGGRVDMLFYNNKMEIPVELKYDANANAYWQIRNYVDMIKERTTQEVNGILLCKHATKSLKELKIDDDIAIIQLDPWKVW